MTSAAMAMMRVFISLTPLQGVLGRSLAEPAAVSRGRARVRDEFSPLVESNPQVR